MLEKKKHKKRKKLLKQGKYICARCGETKPLTEFTKNSSNAHGYSYVCKECRHEYDAKWRGTYDSYSLQKKRNKLLKNNKFLCARCGKIKSLDRFSKNPNHAHGYAYVCKNCRSKYDKKWKDKMRQDPKWVKHRNKRAKKNYHNNIEHHRKQALKYWSKKKDDPQIKLNASMRSGIYHSLKKNKNGSRWENLVGYTIGELKQHLEKQFVDNMSWNNYGSYWEIDHIIPIDSFSFKKPEHIGFKKCWALDNLRPLKSSINRSKGNKLIKDKQEYLVL